MPLRRLARRVHLGRRGTVLALVGAMWIVYGLTVIVTPAKTAGWVPHESVPAWLRGSIWIGTGLCGIIAAWWPPGQDRWGFTALVFMPLVRTMSFAVSAAWWALPGVDTGSPRGFPSACVWAIVSQLIMLIAGWPEPVRWDRGDRGKE